MKPSKLLVLLLALSLVSAVPAWARQDEKDESDEADQLSKATEVFQEIMQAPDKGIPQELIGKANCIVLVPSMLKFAIGFGGQYGRGVASCRRANGAWGPPSFIRLHGGSFGLQLGGQATDLVMLIMNKRGIDFLTRNKFEIGGDASAAAGPVGRQTSAATDAALRAEMLTYSRSRGLFAGISLKGASVRPDGKANRRLYGRAVTPRALLRDGRVPVPESAKPLLAALNKYPART